ncbi:lytic murein transglycosylase [Streptomyces sp. NRRL F-5135]|uniref:lytic transglycosylase domain-containing protein n=1 Tax=Streptomyces sp. NRRL F-5135 TaxID=1463858 RepID=UPI0004C67EF0|nr:lytic murein transglycosylase [Streptomyces sp. NRRL F-5135]
MAAQFGRRLRRTATTTAVAAAAIAALSASQAPGALPTGAGGGTQSADDTPPPDSSATGNSPYYTELPPLTTPDKPGTSTDLPVTGPAEAGIPATVLAAYKQAEKELAKSKPGCNLPWQLLAAIGKVESGQARGGRVDAGGTTISPILGPVLNGNGFANIPDTDNGEFDGDSTHDRAVGPMQFIPSTWDKWGQDANGDGRRDPNNIYDAALAAANYLCAGSRDLSVQADLDRAILSYNHSQEYLNTVLTWFEYYKKGTHEVPDGTGVLPVGTGPADPGPSASPSPSPGTGAGPATGATTPGASPSPGTPSAPGPSSPEPGGGSTGPSTPGGGPTTPPPGGGSQTPTPPSTPEKPETPETPVVKRIEKAGKAALTAMAGGQFTERAAVRAVDADGRPVAGVPVRFQIVGDTDTRFTGGKLQVLVPTGKDGVATALTLQAGERTGKFTVRATAAVKDVAVLDQTATVTARQADALTADGDTALTAAPGTAFTDRVEATATYRQAAAPKVAATAVITSEGGAAPLDKGPYFKGADGSPTRELTGLTTDENGVLRLPEIFADTTTGTFLLRLETEGGGTLTIELKVAGEPAGGPSEEPTGEPAA